MELKEIAEQMSHCVPPVIMELFYRHAMRVSEDDNSYYQSVIISLILYRGERPEEVLDNYLRGELYVSQF